MIQRENKEWMQSWCDETNSNDLPRVLLIGDSITRGYQERVRTRLLGVCYVDYLSLSYAIDQPIYNKIIQTFIETSKYDIIHFNHGLHGKHLSKRSYESRVRKLLDKISVGKKIILATTTIVYHANSKRKRGDWMKRVRERNSAVLSIAEDKKWAIDDLYTVSTKVPFEKRASDGFHYATVGYEMLADSVAESIKNVL